MSEDEVSNLIESLTAGPHAAAGLDIETPKGQKTLEQERHMIASFHKTFPSYHYYETDKTRDSVNDGIILRPSRNEIVAVTEAKCRNCTVEDITVHWCNEWLITWKKVRRNADLAREMRLNLVGILYCVKSGVALMKKLYDGNSDVWLTDFRTAHTETQRTINGGRVVRENAFINMEGAFRFKVVVP